MTQTARNPRPACCIKSSTWRQRKVFTPLWSNSWATINATVHTQQSSAKKRELQKKLRWNTTSSERCSGTIKWLSSHAMFYSHGTISHALTSLTVISRRLSRRECHMRVPRRLKKTALSETSTNSKPRKPKRKRNLKTRLISSYKNMRKSTGA